MLWVNFQVEVDTLQNFLEQKITLKQFFQLKGLDIDFMVIKCFHKNVKGIKIFHMKGLAYELTFKVGFHVCLYVFTQISQAFETFHMKCFHMDSSTSLKFMLSKRFYTKVISVKTFHMEGFDLDSISSLISLFSKRFHPNVTSRN